MKTQTEPKIRRATVEDLPILSRLASRLALQHQDYDRQRFKLPEPLIEEHGKFFAEQLADENAILLVLELNSEIAGYAFIRVEPASFAELLDESVWLHDIFLDEAVRGKNAGKLLLDAVIETSREIGFGALMLSVSPQNEQAQKLFSQNGFRSTLIEMRLDFEKEENKI